MKRGVDNFRTYLIIALLLIGMAMLVIRFPLPASAQDPNATLPPAKKTTPVKKTATTKKPPARRANRTSGAKPTQTPTQSTTESTEPEFWEAIRNSSDPQDFKDYLAAFPNGAHAAIARTKIRQLEAAKMMPTNSPATSGRNLSSSYKNQTGIEFVLIPPGSFMMGSNNGEADEKPAHQVTINYSFYMGKYEVTKEQLASVMGYDASYLEDCGNCPAVHVSWRGAQEFISKLNQMNDGYTYRLPTEAEWEYACRAGTTGDYAGELKEMAWFRDNSGKRTHAVGQKQPNPWGLADMHGNVWEWCEDWYHETYYGAPTDATAWLSGGEQKYRVLRGGSWNSFGSDLRSANRDFRYAPDVQFDYSGFRVVAIARTQ